MSQIKVIVCCLLCICMLSWVKASHTIYDTQVERVQVIDQSQKAHEFPKHGKINVVIFLNPGEPTHIQRLTEIKILMDQFSKYDLGIWTVCNVNNATFFPELADLGCIAIIDTENKIIRYIKEFYCNQCLSIMFIKNNKIKYWSSSISLDFIREWIKENLKNED